MVFARLAAVASLLALAACVTPVPPHEALPPAARDKIASTEMVAPIAQNEIYVYVPPSQLASSGQGGLLGALVLASIDAGVDKTRAGRAEKAVKPLRDAIVDFSFDDTLTSELKTAMAQVSWLHLDAARVVKETSVDSLNKAIADSKASAVLITAANYELSNDGSVLTVTLVADLYPNSDALNALKKPANTEQRSHPLNAIYRNTFVFEISAPGAGTNRDANIAAWSANRGEPMRVALKRAAAKLSQMLAVDVQDGGDASLNDAYGVLTRNQDGTIRYVATAGW
jgi:hypothetical protein